ncbi:MAG: hypothetical protein AAF639_40250 [Chloroflexota bacterium]
MHRYPRIQTLAEKFMPAFTEQQSDILADVITEKFENNVKVSDFTELKEIVARIGEKQDRLTAAVEELVTSHQEMRESQQEMRESQQRMQDAIEKMSASIVSLNENQTVLFENQNQMQKDIGSIKATVGNLNKNVSGLGESLGYSLENEAYRLLPAYLERKHNIKLSEPMLRRYVYDQEVNILGVGTKDDEPIILVGEAKARLGTNHFAQLWHHVSLVHKAQEEGEIAEGEVIPIFVTHMARQQAVRKANREEVMIVHSFEW